MMGAVGRIPFANPWIRHPGRAGLAALALGATALALLRLLAETLPFVLPSFGEPATVMGVGLAAAGVGAILVVVLRGRIATPVLAIPATTILAAAVPAEPAIRVALL